MQRTSYEDYKYSMQDTGNLYIGAKYTLEDILEAENIMFKFQLIVERYILPEADREDTLETHLYYLDKKSFLVKIYKQIKARVKVNILEEKHKLFKGKSVEYVTKVLKLEEFVAMSVEEKEKKGVVVQELIMSKMSLMTF